MSSWAISTPCGALRAGSDRIARSEFERFVASAMRGAERAATLTQRLLAFGRRQPLSPAPIDVNRLVASMSDLLRRMLGETIGVETVLGGGLWRTMPTPTSSKARC